MRALGPRLYTVRGNHDKVVAGIDNGANFNQTALTAAQWTTGRLTPANLRYVRDLPQGPLQIEDGRGDLPRLAARRGHLRLLRRGRLRDLLRTSPCR